jgi:hypothetical protein
MPIPNAAVKAVPLTGGERSKEGQDRRETRDLLT